VRARLLVLFLALVVGSCASTVDRVVSRLGGPQRGFLTPTMLGDGAASPAGGRCTAAGCDPAPALCSARGYRRGSDAYNRCIVSVEQSFRR